MNGILVPFTLGIQTPTQLQAMLEFGHNKLIYMDVTFSTNDVKYHLFTLMTFYFHYTKVLIAWVITSWQTCEDLVECLSTLQAKLLSHTCHIGNHHVSLWMMLQRNSEHCNRLYVDFYFFCWIFLCFGITLAWGFHNIFIVHGKHINVGCTMAGLCKVEILFEFFCTWHVLKTWRLHFMEKIKDSKVRLQYLIASTWWCSCPSTQMRPLMISRHVEGKWWWGVTIIYNLMLFGQDIFGLIIAYSVNKGSPFQVWHVLNPFCYGCISSCMFIFHTFELHHGLKVCCACPYNVLNGWVSLDATLQSKHTS